MRTPVQHSLTSRPLHVFTMQLAWQTSNESKQEIKGAMLGLRQVYQTECLLAACAHTQNVLLANMEQLVDYNGHLNEFTLPAFCFLSSIPSSQLVFWHIYSALAC